MTIASARAVERKRLERCFARAQDAFLAAKTPHTRRTAWDVLERVRARLTKLTGDLAR